VARTVGALVVITSAILALGGCTATAPAHPSFPTGAAVDYQLGGAYDPPDGVGIVARDSTATPAAGVWSICYVNGFQTQPGEEDRWEGANAELVLRDDTGAAVHDPGWPDEALLDTSTTEGRERIAIELGKDITRCATSGFDAVEIDNLDSYTRGDGLTLEGNLALAALYAEQVHALGMLIGQKNTAEHAARLREQVGFDFAVAEECIEFGECAAYTEVYGDAVIDIEYTDDASLEGPRICGDPSRPFATVIRDRDLLTPSASGYVFARC
jgi:hypothetical protein